jgi:hypothetical protein
MAALEPKQPLLVENDNHLLHAPKTRKNTPAKRDAPIEQADRGDQVGPAIKKTKRKYTMTPKRKAALEKARKRKREMLMAKVQEKQIKKASVVNDKVVQFDKAVQSPIEPLEKAPMELDPPVEIPVGARMTDEPKARRATQALKLDLFENVGGLRDETPTIEQIVDNPHAYQQSPFSLTRSERLRDFAEIESTPGKPNLAKKSVEEAFNVYDAKLARQSLDEYLKAYSQAMPGVQPGPGLESYRANPLGGQPSFIHNIQGARTDTSTASDYFSK